MEYNHASNYNYLESFCMSEYDMRYTELCVLGVWKQKCVYVCYLCNAGPAAEASQTEL